jgi:hypothetical protein
MRVRGRAKRSTSRFIAGPFAVTGQAQWPIDNVLSRGLCLSAFSPDSSVMDAGGEDVDTDQRTDRSSLDTAVREQPMLGTILGAPESVRRGPCDEAIDGIGPQFIRPSSVPTSRVKRTSLLQVKFVRNFVDHGYMRSNTFDMSGMPAFEHFRHVRQYGVAWYDFAAVILNWKYKASL